MNNRFNALSETSVNRWGEKVIYTRYVLQEGDSNDKQTVG